MSQKPSDPVRDAGAEPPDGSARDPNDTTAPQGIPVVSRNVELAADAALASMVRSYSRPTGSEHDRVTMPPPVPMEQLVETMMLADSDRVPPDIKPIIQTTTGDSNPPGSDVDTVRTKMADMQRVPMSPAPTSAPQDEVPTVPPYPHDADTLPPSNIADDTEPGFRPLMSDPPPAPSPRTSALNAAGAVLEEFGVELFRERSSIKDVSFDEPEAATRVDETLRTKSPEERRRFTQNSRLTPPRTVRPIPDVTPPSSSTGRAIPGRKRISEPGYRSRESPLPPPPPSERNDRISSPGASTMSERVFEVRERYESGDHRAALRLAEAILHEHPGHLAALGYAESSRQMLRQKYLARIGDMSVVPRIKHVAIELSRLGVDARDVRVVDAINGTLTVEEIVVASGMSTLDVLRVINDLIVDGLVEFLGPATGRR